jgi:hypothetical protein
MGEAKRKEEAAKAAKVVHFIEQEVFFLLQALNGIPTREHKERRNLDRAFEQFGLDEWDATFQARIKAAVEAKVDLDIRTFDKTPIAFEVDIGTVEFLVEKLKTLPIERGGALASRVIGRICDRLIQVSEGRYEAPLSAVP